MPEPREADSRKRECYAETIRPREPDAEMLAKENAQLRELVVELSRLLVRNLLKQI